jgi:hypothetical protein
VPSPDQDWAGEVAPPSDLGGIVFTALGTTI